jgi:hypothetical protein
MRSPRETELAVPASAWLTNAGAAEIRYEVRTHGRSRADVIATMSTGDVVAIELKVRDWRRALHQAVLNRYCAHKSYIGVWWTAISAACEDACRAHGVGLISVEHDRCALVVEAVDNRPLLDVTGRRPQPVCLPDECSTT